MTDVIVSDRFACRRWPTATWVASNEVLYKGEIGFESDLKKRAKRGDGVTGWNGLQFMTPGEIDAVALDAINAGETLVWDPVSGLWKPGPVGLADADSDGNTYGRKNSAWVVVAGGGVPGDASLKTVARFFDECNWASITTPGWVADNAGGAVTVQQDIADMSGAYAAMCGSLGGQRGGATAPGFKVRLGGGEVRCRFRVRPENAPDGTIPVQYEVGLVNNLTTSSTDRIRLSVSNAETGWHIRYTNPSGSLASPITLPVVADITINLDLVINAAGTQASFYADDVLIDQVALPYTFAAMHPMFMSRNNGSSAISSKLWVDQVLVERDT